MTGTSIYFYTKIIKQATTGYITEFNNHDTAGTGCELIRFAAYPELRLLVYADDRYADNRDDTDKASARLNSFK